MKWRYYYNVVWILLSLFACSDNDRTEDSGHIRITTSIRQPDSRISGNNFEEGDKIGVFVVPYEVDNSTPGILGQTDYANNIEHTYTGTSWVTGEGDLLPWPGARRIDIYAYYPYNDAMPDPRNYDFSVVADQSQVEAYMASDFLYSRNLGVSPSASVPLIFSHTLSKININIHSDIVPVKESMDLTSSYIQNIIPACRIDIANGSPTVIPGGSVAEITGLKLAVPVENFDLSVTAVIPPQTIPAATRLLRINNRGINYFYTPEEDITFRQGYTTTFNIEITQQGIIVNVYGVNEWYDGGTIDGNIGEDAPRIVDIDAIDWNQSYVHYMYDGNTLIGQVCREYLSRNTAPTLDIPAIVVYPLGSDGKMDLTKGFVARVYNRTRNSSNQYIFNTGNVHGGSVMFGANNSLSAYTQGNLPLVNKVRIESADNISAAADNTISLLTTVPYTLTDIDDNVYTVTKIGTQYWIRENFKAERYTNGDVLEHYYYNDNPTAYKNMLGAYYTWYAITDPAGIAPEGWRVPTRPDWNSLYQYVNPQTGRKIKASNMWATIANADDVTGFSGLPAGRRIPNGTYNELNSYGQWWASTESSTTNAWRIYADDGIAITEANLAKNYTQSVRLLRDN